MQIKRIIAQQCDRTILLVDHSKFHQRALSKVLDISQIDEVLTDDQTSEDDISTLRKKGMVVHVATISTSASESE
jgi:DeoR/GlpR family transcriptional regulator of sugar metabolism